MALPNGSFPPLLFDPPEGRTMDRAATFHRSVGLLGKTMPRTGY